MSSKSDKNLENLMQENGELTAKIQEITNDLQRVRADFENYRKRTESDLARARDVGEQKAVTKILPILDIFDQVFANLPNEIAQTGYGRGIILAEKNLIKVSKSLQLAKIPAKIGDTFDHNIHNAVQFDENSDGEHEVITEILQNGYTYGDLILRQTMVKVARK